MAVADDIAAGVVALIGGLDLGPTVRDRKDPRLTTTDVPPVAVVSVAEDRDEFETADDDAGRAGWYTLAVSFGRRSDAALTGAAAVRGWRQAVRRVVTGGALAAAVPAVDWADSLPSPQFDPRLLDDGWDWSGLAFRVKTREPRD